MRARILFAATNLVFLSMTSVSAHAGLINPTSTVNVFFDYVSPTLGPQVAPSQVFNSGAPGPFSLSAPIIPPGTPMYTTEPYNLTAATGFWFTNTQVTIYNNLTPPAPFCFSNPTATGSSCNDPYNTFDFKFTNEAITSVTVDPSSSADFLPATFGSHTGLTLVSPNEFTVDVTGENPAFLSTLVIDVTTASSAPGPVPGAGVLGLAFFVLAGVWTKARGFLAR